MLGYFAAMSINLTLVSLGLKIHTVRTVRRLNQEEVAFRSGVSRSYYSDVERGRRNVSAINLIQIAKALDVEVGELFPKLADL